MPAVAVHHHRHKNMNDNMSSTVSQDSMSCEDEDEQRGQQHFRHHQRQQQKPSYVVSPPSSPQGPRQVASQDHIPSLAASFDPSRFNDVTTPWSSSVDEGVPEVGTTTQDPQTGDVAFFEGHKFRYLDHYDLVDAIGVFEESPYIACV